MKHRFKEKCDKCGQFSFFYSGYEKHIICDSCIEKGEEEPKEKDIHKAKQTNIFDFI